jgi:hypothetical protein
MNSHDWIQLVQTAGDYILGGLFSHDTYKEDALHSLVAVCNSILQTSSDYKRPEPDIHGGLFSHDAMHRDQIDKLKVMVVEAIVKCEKVLPRTELPVMLHILLHVPDCMYRWNSVRNFWSFFGERCMGYIIRFIHNRDLAAENIMTAYCRLRLVLDSPPRAVADMMAKLSAQRQHLPYDSMLSISKEIVRLKDGLPGEYSLYVDANRRNCAQREYDDVPTEHKCITGCVKKLLVSLKYPTTYTPKDAVSCELFIAGIQLNGRVFRQGDHCEYLPKVAVRPNVPGVVGGSLGSSASHLIGTVGLFYRFQMNGGPSPAMFVSVKPRKIKEKERSLYILDGTGVIDEAHVHKKGHSHVHTLQHTLIHIDAITAKVKIVPHYDLAKRAAFMCAIPMWHVR